MDEKMKFNKRVARLLPILILIGIILTSCSRFRSPPIEPNLFDDDGRGRTPDCLFPIWGLFCHGYAFDAQTDSFQLTVRSMLSGDFIVEKMSLVQELPENKVNCWLNLSELPLDVQYGEPHGLIIQIGGRVDMKLQCTEFESTDVERGVWDFDTTVHWLKDGELHPAELASDWQSHFPDGTPLKPRGFLRINYHACGLNNSEWCESKIQ